MAAPMHHIQFMPKLIQYLREHELIYTVRKYRLSNAVVTVTGTDIRCQREFIGEILAYKELEPFVCNSGFASLGDWSGMIDRFIRGDDMYLYRVVVIGKTNEGSTG